MTKDEALAVVKRCPWCGRKPSVGIGQRRTADTLYSKKGGWFMRPTIACRRGCPIRIRIETETLEEAVTIWNTRKG